LKGNELEFSSIIKRQTRLGETSSVLCIHSSSIIIEHERNASGLNIRFLGLSFR
jgi:hypothetical protein